MIKIIKTFLIFFSLSAVFNRLFIGNVYADVGAVPPIYSQGSTLQAISSSTNVSMDYEKVILTYGQPQRKYDDKGQEWDATMTVHVSAVFKMKNNGIQVEKLTVYFPSTDSTFVGGWGDDITNFKVNGKSIAKESLGNIPLTIDGKEEKILAYQWQETFNPQQINEITVEYDTKSIKRYDVYYLTYVLGTGRGWQGNIKQGEINFVLPENLVSYSVLDKVPQLDIENKLPFKVSGNTITVSFSEYEPSNDDAIVLGVYEFNEVSAIEQLKNEPQTFANVLKIAGLFRQLSGGSHCVFCTGVASQNAKDYYNLALDKATSKDELNSVLKSFAYGDGDWGNTNDFLKMINLKGCEVDNVECKAKIYLDYLDEGNYGEGVRWSVFWLDTEKGQVSQSDFLIKYANKIQMYDPTISASINSFLSGAKEVSIWWKQRDSQTQTSVSPTPSQAPESTSSPTRENTNLQQKQQKNYSPQLIVMGALIATVLLVMSFWIIRKRNLIKILKQESSIEIKEKTIEIDKKQNSENKLNNEKAPLIKK